MGQVHGISKILRSRNNSKGTWQVKAAEDNLRPTVRLNDPIRDQV
jgi:hypothetical protein